MELLRRFVVHIRMQTLLPHDPTPHLSSCGHPSRRVRDEADVTEGLAAHPLFLGIVGAEAGLQVRAYGRMGPAVAPAAYPWHIRSCPLPCTQSGGAHFGTACLLIYGTSQT